MLLVIAPRDLCRTGGGYNAETKEMELSLLCRPPQTPHPSLGGRGGEVGGRSCCPGPAVHPGWSSLPRLLSLCRDCCRPSPPHLPLPSCPLCPVSVQVTSSSHWFSHL